MTADLPHIYDIVERRAAATPAGTAVSFGDRRWSWRELDDRVRRAAGALRAAGIGPADRIAFLDKNHPACLELTLAASLVGAANAVVNFRLAPDELGYVLADSQARLVVAGAEFTGALDALPATGRVVVLGGERDEYEPLLAAAEPVTEVYDAAPDDCFLQLYTSGTTGRPKGAMLTQRSMTAHTVMAARAYGMDAGTVNVVAMPLFHVGGTSWALGSMYAGGQTVIVRDVVPAAVLDLIEDQSATHAFFVPAVIQMLLADPVRARQSLGGLRVLGYGGSPMPAPLMERTLEILPTPLYSVYGMTELSGVFCALGPPEHRDPGRMALRASAGRPLPGNEVRVVDPATGQDVATGQLGEFWVRSEQAMAGYWNQPEATAATITADGWLRTGDLGYIDADGYLFIQDRVKDMIISGGENIYPAEVERVLIEHPSVADVAVIGVPDDRWGEAVQAVVVPADGTEPSPQELISFARERLAHYKCPASVRLVDALPRNASGKVLKRNLRASAGS